MAFCVKCGKEAMPESDFCESCIAAEGAVQTGNTDQFNAVPTENQNLIQNQAQYPQNNLQTGNSFGQAVPQNQQSGGSFNQAPPQYQQQIPGGYMQNPPNYQQPYYGQPPMYGYNQQPSGALLKKFKAGGKWLSSSLQSLIIVSIFLCFLIMVCVAFAMRVSEGEAMAGDFPFIIVILIILCIVDLAVSNMKYRNCKKGFLCVCEDRIYGTCAVNKGYSSENFQIMIYDIIEVKAKSGGFVVIDAKNGNFKCGVKKHKEASDLINSLLNIRTPNHQNLNSQI